ncbi:MAG: polysaccharide biosynthesis protein [Cyclobacteriaceae bacterium]|nr:polysaccharide biosynthesis protein [Cyclobacteriaceae bacterium]
MGKLTKLAGETAIYGLSSIVGRAVNFLLVPFYTSASILSVAENGIQIEFYAYAAFLNIIYLLGMETAFFRFVSKNPSNSDQVYNTALSFIIFTSLGLSVLLSLLAEPISIWLDYPHRPEFIYWFSIILAVDAIVSIPFARLRYEHKAVNFAVLKITNIGLNISLNIFFLYFCKNVYQGNFLVEFEPLVRLVYRPEYNVEYVFISNLIANLMYLPLMASSFRNWRIRIDTGMLKQMFWYSLPLMIMGLAGVTNEMLSRSLLRQLLPDNFYPGQTAREALGIFGNCYKLSLFMSLAIQAFRYAAEPFFFAQTLEKNTEDTYARVFYYFVIFGAFAILAISMNLDIIKVIFLRNPKFWEGLHVVPVLLVANFFLGLYYNFSIWYKITDKTYFGMLISIVAALATLVLNVWLIPIGGYEASSFITLTVYAGMAISAFMIGKKYYPVPYNLKKAGLYFAIAIILLFAGLSIENSSAVIRQLLRQIPLLLYVLLVYFIEKPMIKNFIK